MKIIAAMVLALLFWPAPAAHGATPPAYEPTPADLAAALKAAIAAKPTVQTFFDTQRPGQAGSGIQISGPVLPVNDLDTAFVTGESPRVSRFSFLAVRATAPGGLKASMWMTRTPQGAWVLGTIASGDQEQQYAAQPGTVFREQQLGAWYAVRGDRVVPLNERATAASGKPGLTVAEYQRLVHDRYADKLPGSDFDRNGLAGGTATTAVPAAPSGWGPWPWLAGVGVLLAGLLAVRLLRRA
ncbi:hypothetical protein [Spongiactinospora sp. 9N601]|uniref:hypothetical protein n=1 Tax=Spongiactinospora sp. 9N601 TaxID=3375149 RepID=UPI0037988402